MKIDGIGDYNLVSDVMKDVLNGRIFRNSESSEVYVFESLFPSQEGVYLSFRGRNIRTGKLIQRVFNTKNLKELEIVEPSSELARIAQGI